LKIPSIPFEIELFDISSEPFDQSRFHRRQKTSLEGRTVWLPTAEDVIVQKLRWATLGNREKDMLDVVGILKVRRDRLDFTYVGIHEVGPREGLPPARPRAIELKAARRDQAPAIIPPRPVGSAGDEGSECHDRGRPPGRLFPRLWSAEDRSVCGKPMDSGLTVDAGLATAMRSASLSHHQCCGSNTPSTRFDCEIAPGFRPMSIPESPEAPTN